MGDYSFDRPLARGDKLVFADMALYTIVKNTAFNGIGLPAIAVLRPASITFTRPRLGVYNE
jgi:carboxynorspermidine decarboxylase